VKNYVEAGGHPDQGVIPQDTRSWLQIEADQRRAAQQEAEAFAVLARLEAQLQASRSSRFAALAKLKQEMLDAHPDRGGTAEGFIAARNRYLRACGK
jgi:hypothetical protein